MAEISHRIEVDPQRCHGKPVISGTRVMVRTVLGALAAGDSPERIAESYRVSVEDVPCGSCVRERACGRLGLRSRAG